MNFKKMRDVYLNNNLIYTSFSSSATRRQTLAFGFSNARDPPDACSDARALNAQRIGLQTATQHGPCPPYNGLGGGGETPLV
jgi:hypothetical protein